MSTTTTSFTGTIVQRFGQITVLYEIRPDPGTNIQVQGSVYAFDPGEVGAIPNGARVRCIGAPFSFYRYVTIAEWWLVIDLDE